MDFSTYELSDEVKAKLAADYEKSVLGLKAKNSELIEREREAKEAHMLSTKAEEDAKVALAEKNGDIATYKTALADRDARLTSIEAEFKEKETKRISDAAVNEFLSAHVSNDPAARHYMDSVLRKSINVIDGEVKSLDVTKTYDQLLNSIVSDNSFSNYIREDVGSGGGSNGSTKANGAARSLSEMNTTEKAIFANKFPEQYALMTKQ